MIKQKLVYLLLFFMVAGFAKAQDAPYDIERFQAFLKECKLQAPTSATAATASDIINGYSSDNFYVVETDRIAFNQTGESMRTELRHETNWLVSDGDRTFEGRMKIVEQTCDQVTVVQIHDDANAGSGPNKPLLRIYKHLTRTPVNHLWAAVKTDDGGVNTTHMDLGLAPTDYFDWKVSIENENMVIDINGEEKVNVDVSFWTFPSYWKAGVYLQDPGEATVYFDELFRDGMIVTGLDEFSSSIRVYPNPSADLLTIEAGTDELLKATVTVFDPSGRVLREVEITERNMELQLPKDKGLYLVRIQKEDYVKTLKVLKN